MSSTTDDARNNNVNVDPLQTFSKTCSVIYGRINKKQFEYLQAITSLQEGILGSCNSLVDNQVNLIEEYSKRSIVKKEQIIPIIETANKIIESYLNYLSLEYDLVLARIRLHHRMLMLINDSSPKLTQLYMEWLNSVRL